eukprot:8476505-Alexandrium_andersonii.AAC.1
MPPFRSFGCLFGGRSWTSPWDRAVQAPNAERLTQFRMLQYRTDKGGPNKLRATEVGFNFAPGSPRIEDRGGR